VKSLRSLICASVLALGFMLPAVAAPAAKAEAPRGGQHGQHRHYRVYWYSYDDGGWMLYSTHRRHWRAMQFARYLQSLGYKTWVG